MGGCKTAILSKSKFVFFAKKRKKLSALRLQGIPNLRVRVRVRLRVGLWVEDRVRCHKKHKNNEIKKNRVGGNYISANYKKRSLWKKSIIFDPTNE